MVTIRNFTKKDINELKEKKYFDMTYADIEDMIGSWELKEYNGQYFEMFAVVSNNDIVGYTSLMQCDNKDAVSIGIEIFPSFRHRGYAKEAEELTLAYAREHDYNLVRHQIRIDNEPSIFLHKKLGFVQKSVTINRKGNKVYLFENVL